MTARCIRCEIEIEEPPLCLDCAMVVVARLRDTPGRRHGSTPTYHQYVRAVPLRPVSVPPIAFGKEKT